jgi:hypothetical protein
MAGEASTSLLEAVVIVRKFWSFTYYRPPEQEGCYERPYKTMSLPMSRQALPLVRNGIKIEETLRCKANQL